MSAVAPADTMRIRCPTCRTEAEVARDFAYRPFCSKRCKMADLANWFDEAYKLSRPLRADDLSDDETSL